MPLLIVRLEASRLRAAKSAGRHPCSTAWRDVRGLRPAVLPLNFVVLKLKILRPIRPANLQPANSAYA
jgi:hypothetical protein